MESVSRCPCVLEEYAKTSHWSKVCMSRSQWMLEEYAKNNYNAASFETSIDSDQLTYELYRQ